MRVHLLSHLISPLVCRSRLFVHIRGNHESGGVWRLGDLTDDVEDIQVVVDYLKVNYGYVVDLVIGHSRGAIVSFHWLSASFDGRKVSAFVNLSGRYRMPVRPLSTYILRHK